MTPPEFNGEFRWKWLTYAKIGGNCLSGHPENNQIDKHAYKRPEIESEKIFEQNALACAKCNNISQVTVLGACVRGTSKKS